MNNKFFIVMGTLLYILLFVMIWSIYSLFRFEGQFSPWYVYGISRPFEYWQEHIGLQLIEHGKQYNLKLSIDENDPRTYNIYRNKKHNFEFKYPKEFCIKVDDKFFPNNTGTSIEIFDKTTNKPQCGLSILYRGWGVGKEWLPRKRLFMENYIKKGNMPLYFLTKQGQIVHTNSGGNPNSSLIEKNSGLVTYINSKRGNDILDVSFGCEKNNSYIINDIITTLQFID